MRQLALPGDRRGEDFWDADAELSAYLTRVLRLTTGAALPAVDAAGNRFQCHIVACNKGRVRLALRQAAAQADGLRPTFTAAAQADGAQPEHGAQENCSIVLVQALPKGKKMDTVIRQATEAGVLLIQPLVSAHCVAQSVDDERAQAKSNRRAKIVREALQQSGSSVATRVAPTLHFKELFANLDTAGYRRDNAVRLFCHEKPLAEKGLHQYLAGRPERIIIAIGPEGGFSKDECAQFEREGFLPVHFSGSILRAETAAIYAVAAIKTIRMEQQLWNPVSP